MNGRDHAYRLERKRQWKHKKSAKGAFERSFVSLDQLEREVDPEKSDIFSDDGAGTERIFDAIDGDTFDRRCAKAREFLLLLAPRLVEVFDLVVKNGSRRKVSVRRLAAAHGLRPAVARDRYWDHLKKLLKIFSAQ